MSQTQSSTTTSVKEFRKWRRVHGLQLPLHPQQEQICKQDFSEHHGIASPCRFHFICGMEDVGGTVKYFCAVLEAQFIGPSNSANLNCVTKPYLSLNSDSYKVVMRVQ